MVISDQLFQLIRSLNKNEKGYFKKFSSLHIRGEKNNYIKLFDAIDKQKVYDEQKIVELLKKEKFVSHISVVKNYLYNLILKSLDSYHQNVNKELNTHIHHIEILLEKGLFKQCESILKRAKKTALQYESMIHLVQLQKFESNLMHVHSFHKKESSDITRLYNDIFSNLDKYKNLLSYESLLSEVYINIYKKGMDRRDKEKLQIMGEIFRRPLLMSETKAMTYEAKTRFHKCHIAYSFMLGDMKTAMRHTKTLISLMEDNPHQMKEYQSHYLAALQNHIVTLAALKQYDEALKNINKVRTIPIKSERVNNRMFFSMMNQELEIYSRIGQFSKGVALIETLSPELKIFSKDHRTYFYYLCGYMYFGEKKYSQCVKSLYKVINAEDISMRSDIYSFSKILNLIAHYEMGNFDLLEYVLKSTYNFLNTKNRLFRFETVLLNFLKKQLAKNPQGSELTTAFENLKKEIILLLKDPAEQNVLKSFDIESWIESKITGKAFSQLVKEKNSEKKRSSSY